MSIALWVTASLPRIRLLNHSLRTRLPVDGNSLKRRAHNLKRLHIRRSVQESFQPLYYFGITNCVVSLGIRLALPEADGRDFPAIGTSEGNQIEEAFLPLQPRKYLSLNEIREFAKRIRLQPRCNLTGKHVNISSAVASVFGWNKTPPHYLVVCFASQ